MLVASEISAGIWRRNDFGNASLDARLAGITAYQITRTFGIRYDQIPHSPTIENLLLACATDWCLIQASGHTYGSKNIQLVRKILTGMTERSDVAVFGHIIDDKSYFGLHHQVVMINAKAWRDGGRPTFGAAMVGEQVVRPIRRSAENAHDDYTPLWLEPGQGPDITVKPRTVGWNFLSHMSGLGYAVLNFGEDFRNKKFFCYPQKKNAAAMLEVLQDVNRETVPTDARLATIVRRFRAARPTGIHVVNNEGHSDIPPKTEEPVGLAVFVASGFKGNVILHRLGFGPETEVIFYDIDEATLEFKRRLIADWDGRDFVQHSDAVVTAMSEQYQTKIFKDVDLRTSYEKMIRDEFGSEEAWLGHWARFRKLRFTCVKADILRKREALISALPRSPRTGRHVVWTSNIFNYGSEIIGMSFEARTHAFASLTAEMRGATGQEPVFIGQAPRDYASGKWV